MHQIIVKPRAIKMTLKAYKWYEKRQLGLGDVFLRELDNCYDKIETWPTSYSKIDSNFRQAILHTFPYVIVFEIINDDIIVYAVFHTSRNPNRKFQKEK